MILNDDNFQKVLDLFPAMPYTTAIYCGCWKPGNISFQIGCTDQYNNIVAGLNVEITQDFKIVRMSRIFTTYNTGLKKNPLKTEKIPLHPQGTTPSIYN